jgi:hypothetical protein
MNLNDWKQLESIRQFDTKNIIVCTTKLYLNYTDWELKKKRNKRLTGWKNSITEYVPYLPVIPAKFWDSALK